MASKRQPRSEVHEIDPRWAEALEASDERRLFREATPVPMPRVSEEELAEITKEEPEEQSENESSSRSFIGPRTAPTEADLAVSPYRYGGILVFEDYSDGQTRYGTAQFVAELNILLTAAHNVRDFKTGGWNSNLVFYRGYKNGNYATKYAITYAGTMDLWVGGTSPRLQYDYAFLRTAGSSEGALGMKTLESEPGWTSMGYPKGYAMGQVMHRVDGTRGTKSGGVIQMLGNPMDGGSSGGAWTVGSIVMGNNSARYASNPDAQWGPVFNNYTFDLYRAVKNA
ncbi:trypsin-like serine peptidase [Nocardia sputorum]|uniref:Serine protease n=1 Tax=Nocardia sputorum TaxID=2984338 RepID=A0ABM8CZJ7_9NOCA|nr:hypothetical protein [Nocardia sputorum]BDU00448.1 hypothetical protein IFM12276_34760 [Nocardia sputorum]